MVAYSFKSRFVTPIRIGLWLPAPSEFGVELPTTPKCQTIRAEGKRRHARPGEELQLYHGLRTKSAFLIGRARCTDIKPIYIEVEAPLIIIGDQHRITTRSELDEFARNDGFKDYEDFALFWYEEHHETMNDFNGLLIRWEPLLVDMKEAA